MEKRTYHVSTQVLFRQDCTRLGRGDEKLGHNGHSLDLLVPGKFNVVANTEWRLRGLLSRVHATGGGGEHLTQRDLDAGCVFGLEGHEVGSDEATKQSSADIVRMPLYKSKKTSQYVNHWHSAKTRKKTKPIYTYKYMASHIHTNH